MQPSTVVRRTDAGNAELAVPAHGLSLTQRRFLTLLDTSCTVDELARRHRAEAAKLDRDLTRLTELGLVVCDIEAPANDAEAAPAATVRLGATPGRRLPLMLLFLAVAGALAFAGWHQWTASDPATAGRNAGAPSSRKATHDVSDSPVVDPQPIATRVLKSDPAERARDATKDARTSARAAEAHVEKALAKPPLPVEHRSPAAEDLTAAPAALGAPIGPSADGPAKPTPAADRPAPVPAAVSIAPAAKPSGDTATPAMDTRSAPPVAPGAPSTAPTPATNPPAAPAAATTADPVRAAAAAGDATPVHLASAAPASGLLRPAPLPALVPIARESPSFPREATALGLADGKVKARLTIDARGNVSSVDIVEASHRAFTRAVRETLMRWRFEPGTGGRTTSVDVAFKRD